MTRFDPAIFQAALLEVAEATKAAAQAAQGPYKMRLNRQWWHLQAPAQVVPMRRT
jgi:hypothetical protein